MKMLKLIYGFILTKWKGLSMRKKLMTIGLLVLLMIALGGCSLFRSNPPINRVQIQVKCPPETGGGTFNIPEIIGV